MSQPYSEMACAGAAASQMVHEQHVEGTDLPFMQLSLCAQSHAGKCLVFLYEIRSNVCSNFPANAQL